MTKDLAIYEAILESLPLMVFVKDADELRFELVNRAGEELLGRTRDELIGRTDHDFFTPEEATFFQTKDREALASATAIDVGEEPITTPSGVRWLRTVKIAMCDESGTPRYLLGISEDITARRELAKTLERTERQLQQAQKMDALGKLAGGVAHDSANLIMVVLMYCEIASRLLDDADPLRTYLDEIASAATRAGELAKQLLAFAREQPIAVRVVDVNEVLVKIERMLRRLIEARVRMTTSVAPNPATVLGDASSIEQVLLNLVVNARDAMPAGGTLSIETANVDLDEDRAAALGAKRGSYVMLTVRDSGVGMDPATLARVFEPFFTTKRAGKGTGLGLATVYGIVRQVGGVVAVESELGKGTSFEVYLPRTEDAVTAELVVQPRVSPRGTETLLVVEDERQLLGVIADALRRSGYRVLATTSPAEALIVAEQHAGPIHLLLTDMVMPLLDGATLAERLQSARPDMRALFMSGYAVDAALRKPFSMALLLRKIRDVIDRK